MATIKFRPNIPVTVTLAYDQPKSQPNKYKPEELQYVYGALGGDIFYATPYLHKQIKPLSVGKGSVLTIVKEELENGKTAWHVSKDSQDGHQKPQDAPQSTETPKAPLDSTKQVWPAPKPITAKKAFEYAVQSVMEIAGPTFTPEDLRHMAISMFIQLGHSYLLSGDFDEVPEEKPDEADPPDPVPTPVETGWITGILGRVVLSEDGKEWYTSPKLRDPWFKFLVIGDAQSGSTLHTICGERESDLKWIKAHAGKLATAEVIWRGDRKKHLPILASIKEAEPDEEVPF